jgi:hypothetical protein
MGKATNATTVVVKPKAAKITKSDITNAILEQSDEVKVGLLNVAVNSDTLNKLTKESLIEIVNVVNPKFEVLKKTTKGEIIPVIMKTSDESLSKLVTAFFTDENLMKQTKDVLEGIITKAGEIISETATEETPTEETPTEETPTDVVITDESVKVVETAETPTEVVEQTETI